MDLTKLPTTGEVAKLLGTTEARVNAVLRRAAEIDPPKLGRLRRWRPADVRALKARLKALATRSA